MSVFEIFDLWLEKAADDEDIVNELVSIKDNANEIEDRFFRELSFGTGGLRGIIGAGINRLNIYTVGKITQGYANYLNANFLRPVVIIAYDSRNKSELFAQTAACVLAANGVKVYIFNTLMPTPVLSFAVRYLNGSGGIVITASHNPYIYNGYKIYGSDGCQITRNAAESIALKINGIDIFDDVKKDDFNDSIERKVISYVPEDVLESYFENINALSMISDSVNRDLPVIYTPLNGAGITCVPKILLKNKFTNISIPKAQEMPDGNFPTCPYPNPEVPEALREGIRLAQEKDAELVLATDPDCDRVGCAVKVNDEFLLINGNQMGVLLLDFSCFLRIQNGRMPKNPIAIKTIVTTNLAKDIADNYGVKLINTLTGFKYIGEQIGLLEKYESNKESRFIFGFEESYGYLNGTYTRDKDAVSASLLICEMAAYYKSIGKTLYDVLEEIYKKYGYYLDELDTFTLEGKQGAETIQAIMRNLRGKGSSLFGDAEKFLDYQKGIDELPAENVLQYQFKDKSIVTVRPSGTEPKIKLYYSICADNKESAIEKKHVIKQIIESVVL